MQLNVGEGRVFQSPNYPANYPNGQSCTYNFEPASGAQLKFSCTDMELTATSDPGVLCTGDYLRSDWWSCCVMTRFYGVC